MQQPKTWTDVAQAARVGEMCQPAIPSPADPNLAVQIELMRDQLNQLSVEHISASVSGPGQRSNGQSQSRSPTHRWVRLKDNGEDVRYDRCR